VSTPPKIRRETGGNKDFSLPDLVGEFSGVPDAILGDQGVPGGRERRRVGGGARGPMPLLKSRVLVGGFKSKQVQVLWGHPLIEKQWEEVREKWTRAFVGVQDVT
jgi:hypothetical protein